MEPAIERAPAPRRARSGASTLARLALRSVVAHKRRLAGTATAIVLGITFISATDMLSASLTAGVDGLVGTAYRDFDGVVRSSAAQESLLSPLPVRDPIDAALVDRVAGIDGVAYAEGRLQAAPTLLDRAGKRIDTTVIPTYAYNYLEGSELTIAAAREGRPPRSPDEVAIDFGTAEQFGFLVGDPITVQFPNGAATLTVTGIGGIGGEGDIASGSRMIVLETSRLQQLMGVPGRFDYVAYQAERGVDPAELAGRVASVVPADVEAITGEAFIAESQAQYSEFVDVVTMLVSIFGYLAMFVGAFIIYNTFSIVIAQRTAETALLRSIGLSRRQLLYSILLESSVIGVAATAAGLIGGVVMATSVRIGLASVLTLPGGLPRLTAQTIAVSFALGTGVSAVAALLPAWTATRIPPVALLRETAAESDPGSRTRWITCLVCACTGAVSVWLGLDGSLSTPALAVGLGAAMLFVSLVAISPMLVPAFLGFAARPLLRLAGVPGRLAEQNAARNPRRTASTAIAVCICVSIVSLVAVVAASFSASLSEAFEQRVRADLIVTSGAFGAGGFTPVIVEEIRATPGVAMTSSMRFGPARVLSTDAGRTGEQRGAGARAPDGVTGPPGDSSALVGVDPSTFFDLVDVGLTDTAPPDLSGLSTIVTRRQADQNGWDVGDQIATWFARRGVIDLRISAIVERGLGRPGLIVSQQTFADLVTPDMNVDNLVYVKASSPRELGSLASTLESTLQRAAPAASVQNLEEYVADQSEVFDQFVYMLYALMLLAIVIALIGVANTMSLSIHERGRELALLRAVGAGRKQIRRAVRLETIVICAFGASLGVAAGAATGAAFSSVLADFGVELTIPPVQLVAIGLAGGGAGWLASIGPSRRAASVDILGAITSE